jgi:hypothetical protein
MERPSPPPPPPSSVTPSTPPEPRAQHLLHLNPQVIPWIALPVLVLSFLFLFFDWNGAYPGGYGVYTQSAFQALFGSFSTDPVGEEILHSQEAIRENIRANWIGITLYLLLLLAGLALAIAAVLRTHTSLRFAPIVRQYWPWRSTLLAVVTLLACVVLCLQLWSGMGVENALISSVDASLEEERAAAQTPDRREQFAIRRGMRIGELTLQRTAWVWLSLLCDAVALVGAALEIRLEKHGAESLPRLGLHW